MGDRPVDEEHWSIIPSHAHGSRWRSLDLEAEWSDALETLQRHHAPNLNTLRLRFPPKNSALVMDHIFARSTPKLVHVELERVGLNSWAPTSFGQLRSLNLHYISPYGLSVESLIAVLKESPGLVSLSLFKNGFGQSHCLAKPPVKIELLRLKHVELVTNQPEAVLELVQRISAPYVARILLQVWSPLSWGRSAVLDLATHYAVICFVEPSLRNHLLGATTLDITWSVPIGFGLELAWPGPAWRFELFTLSTPGALMADWLSELLKPEGSTEISSHLSLTIGSVPFDMSGGEHARADRSSLEEFTSLLWRYPSLGSLYLLCRMLPEGFWAALSRPRMEADGSYQWLCPRLYMLAVSGSGARNAGLIADAVAKRAKAASDFGGGWSCGVEVGVRSWGGDGKAILGRIGLP